MENYQKTFETICRVCLQHDNIENMVSLTEESEENGLKMYGEQLEKLAKISVKESDYLPTKMCHECKKTLEKLTSFMLKCQTSDKKLSKLVSFSLKQDLTGEMVKEVVCQYTLFCQYFPEDSNQPSFDSTTNFEVEVKPITKDHIKMFKSEGKHSKIKLEASEIPQIESDNDDNFQDTCDTDIPSETDSSNVDIFLDSIEKLVSYDMKSTYKRRRLFRKLNKIEKTKPRNIRCNICLKTLANQATYHYHMERMHGHCRFICEKCGKGFPIRAELTQHQIYRHGIGQGLKCDHCSYKAGKRFELIEHTRLHTGERPFTCEKCGLTFRRRAIYRNHLKCHYEKSIQCTYCPRMFYRRHEMLAHCNNVHVRMYLYVCNVCNVMYAKTETVRKHMAKKHGIPRKLQGNITRIKNVNVNNVNPLPQEINMS